MIQVKQDQENGYIFELNAESGHTLLKSIPFSNKKTALKTAKTLNRLLTLSPCFERKTTHNGQFLFNFKNSDGVLIGRSQLYNSEAGMENGIKNLTNRITTISKSKQL